jgi:uncharacterized membrane protein
MPELNLLLLARVVHIVGGMIWAGGAIIIATFLLPAVRAAGPAGVAVMRELTVVRQLPSWLAGSGLASIIAGLYLYEVDSGHWSATWICSAAGTVYGLGGLAAVVALFLGVGVNLPTARRLGLMASTLRQADRTPTAQEAELLQKLTRRIGRTTRAVGVLLAVCTIAMAVARYLG